MSIRARFDKTGVCQIVDAADSVRSTFPTVYSFAFNSQYPPPISPDGEVLYVGSWEKGLFSYRTSDGVLNWRKGPGKVRNIFPVPGAVVVEMADRGLICRDQESGATRNSVKMSGIEFAQRISSNHLFAGPHRQRYFQLSLPDLKVVGVVESSQMNPRRCLSFVLRETIEMGDEILIRGFEEYPDGDYARPGVTKFQRSVKPRAA